MSIEVTSLPGGGTATPARPAGRAARDNARRLRLDRFAARFVSFSGVTIILAILAILVVIVAVAYPLALSPRATRDGAVALPLPAGARPLAIAVEEYREKALLVSSQGLRVVALGAGAPADATALEPPAGTTVVSASVTTRGKVAMGLSDGRVLATEPLFEMTYGEGNQRTIRATLPASAPLTVDPAGREVRLFRYVTGPNGPVVVAATGPRELSLATVTETAALIGEATREERQRALPIDLSADVTALALDGRAEDLFVGTAAGEIVRLDLRDVDAPKQAETVAAGSKPDAAITTLGLLNGDRTLVVGDRTGGVSTWQLVVLPSGEKHLTRVNVFVPHAGAVTAFSPSRRDKGFVTGDATGHVRVHYATTGKTILELGGATGAITGLIYAPKADGVLATTDKGTVERWTLRNPHPEITWRALFGKVWYEGYAKPEYVWQSTGGTDDFEAKFSLVPLLYGTLKGTFYALLIAIPLSLLGALYTAQFMHPSLKSVLKPTVEIMAALPSVVLGFIAGLWLAPAVERIVPGIVVMAFVMPALIVLSAWVWERLPIRVRTRVKPGYEFSILIPVVLLSGWASIACGGLFERALLHGDYRTVLLSAFGLAYDQRNSVVVGLAMGFAVIPIIFTVAEDAIASVPQGLTAGSLALGATRWQTAMRTVLPTASPGIFSAIMIGFGRAVGETMIVLMATGNTPVMNLSPFSGFRALSANIAVELPEAPEGGTLFRVLFLAALLLYLLTFTLNTAAELVRLRLRKKYRTYE